MALLWSDPKRILLCEHDSKEGVHIAACRGDITVQKADVIVNAANVFLRNNGGVAGCIKKATPNPNFQSECDEWVKEHGPLKVGHSAVVTPYSPTVKCIHVVGPIWRMQLKDEIEVGGTVELVEGEKLVIKIDTSAQGELPDRAETKIYRAAAGFFAAPGAKVKALGKMKAGEFITRYFTGEGYHVQESDQDLLRACVTNAFLKADEEGAKSLCIPAIGSGIFGFPLDLGAKIHIECALGFARTAKSVKLIVFLDFDEEASAALARALSDATGDLEGWAHECGGPNATNARLAKTGLTGAREQFERTLDG